MTYDQFFRTVVCDGWIFGLFRPQEQIVNFNRNLPLYQDCQIVSDDLPLRDYTCRFLYDAYANDLLQDPKSYEDIQTWMQNFYKNDKEIARGDYFDFLAQDFNSYCENKIDQSLQTKKNSED